MCMRATASRNVDQKRKKTAPTTILSGPSDMGKLSLPPLPISSLVRCLDYANFRRHCPLYKRHCLVLVVVVGGVM